MMVQTQIKMRPVFCVIEHLHRDLALAENVSHGRFTLGGITRELGLSFDWLTANFPNDPEWRMDLSKFYYGLDLAFAGNETGNPQFLNAWGQLLTSWIKQVPTDLDPNEVIGRRLLNWIYAWSAFKENSDGMSDELEQLLFASIDQQSRYLRRNLSAERNHRTLELYALFIVAVALPDLDADGSLREFTINQLHENILSDIREDGVQRENSTHYHMIVLRSFLGVLVNARRFASDLPANFAALVERACEFALHCHRPDGLIPALSDSDTGNYRDVLRLAAHQFDRLDFLYVATNGRHGIPPEQTNVSFPQSGYFVQRSDWSSSARYLVFDCGPLGAGGHGHYDALNVEIAANGQPLIVDPGRFTYSEHGPINWRHWFKSTAAHNTVCVDGLDQTPYRCGKPRDPVATATLIQRLNAPGLDVLCGEVTSPAYEVKHRRTIVFVRGEYWLILDQLSGDRPHRFDLRFHLTPAALNHTTVSGHGFNSMVRTPEVALVFAPARLPSVEPGWVAPMYGIKYRAPVISIVNEGEAEACFFTLVVPLAANESPPSLQVWVQRTQIAETLHTEVKGVGPKGAETDRFSWSAGPGPFQFRMAWDQQRGIVREGKQ
jgi:hypothetical protein